MRRTAENNSKHVKCQNIFFKFENKTKGGISLFKFQEFLASFSNICKISFYALDGAATHYGGCDFILFSIKNVAKLYNNHRTGKLFCYAGVANPPFVADPLDTSR